MSVCVRACMRVYVSFCVRVYVRVCVSVPNRDRIKEERKKRGGRGEKVVRC